MSSNEFIGFIIDNNIDIINEKINNIISNDDKNDNDYKNDNDRKDLLIKIQRELIQMKVKELNNIKVYKVLIKNAS